MERLKEFAKGRPIDEQDLISGVIEYIELIERVSIDRYHELNRKGGVE